MIPTTKPSINAGVSRAGLDLVSETQFMKDHILKTKVLHDAEEHLNLCIPWCFCEVLKRTLTAVLQESDKLRKTWLAMIYLGEVAKVGSLRVLEQNKGLSAESLSEVVKTMVDDLLMESLQSLVENPPSFLMSKARGICTNVKDVLVPPV